MFNELLESEKLRQEYNSWDAALKADGNSESFVM